MYADVKSYTDDPEEPFYIDLIKNKMARTALYWDGVSVPARMYLVLPSGAVELA